MLLAIQKALMMIDHWVTAMTSTGLMMAILMMMPVTAATANTACTTRATASTAITNIAGRIQTQANAVISNTAQLKLLLLTL